MKKLNISTTTKNLLADLITPVGLYLKIRDKYARSILMESSDYQSAENSYSFIACKPLSKCELKNGSFITETLGNREETQVDNRNFKKTLSRYFSSIEQNNQVKTPINGFFGYLSFDSIPYIEDIRFTNQAHTKIPESSYSFYQFIIAFNHFKNELTIIENIPEGNASEMDEIIGLLHNKNVAEFPFSGKNGETSNLTDDVFNTLVEEGKQQCQLGNTYQVVLSRAHNTEFSGDEFNVYRALRSINPSPYLFYFDFGSYKLFGSSPEAQLVVRQGTASIFPIAGTFKRTGNDKEDEKAAIELSKDEKENAEHVMLVDLARNDLSRSCKNVRVEKLKEIQFYSHVIHLVSEVCGDISENKTGIDVLLDTFPAGTLSGAPKIEAMKIIDTFENQSRGFYGGCIGNINLNGDVNTAIMIRTFLSHENKLHYQAGAGIVRKSDANTELQEVNNKLGALRSAIQLAEKINN